ncbi:cytochrome c oxidase subunit 3 [Mycobacterium sp.]|uniref:cytochrome c oxidase subunit 3 n=1 Tax=Mycobacterium sp. TaxID=1785 RepID=UPI001218B3FD|nr:cytochrome c oxidase subunit 3 [Mycobacterium sp.]TAM65772.1 MAG: cytochrome c oxidase subunit 3 family protein [Mycobacterium sp.]
MSGSVLEVDAKIAATRRHLPGEPGIWFVIFGDLLAFGALFLTFMYYRAKSPHTFAAGHQAMNLNIGVVNTLVLLTGSLAVVQGVGAYRAGARRAADQALTAAIVCGATFLLLKSFEYGQKVSQSLLPNSSEFFTLYYTFTGVHFAHVVFGVAILVYMRRIARRPEPDFRDREIIESGGIFWHLVDLLWMAFFALFYLVHS